MICSSPEARHDNKPRAGGPILFEQGDEDFVGDAEAIGREAKATAVEFDETLLAEVRNLIAQSDDTCAQAIHRIRSFDAREIDALELAQAEEEFFVERLLGRDCLDLLARAGSLLDARDVARGIMHIRPARAAVE